VESSQKESKGTSHKPPMNETNCKIRLAVLFIYGFLTQFIPYFMRGRSDRTLDYAVKKGMTDGKQ